MSVSQVPRRPAVSSRCTLLSPIDGGRCVRLPGRQHERRPAAAGALIFVDCCRAGIAELLAAGGSTATIEQTIDVYRLDGDEQDALRLWALQRQAATPVADVNAAGCELRNDKEAR